MVEIAQMLIYIFSLILLSINLYIGFHLLKRVKITGLTNIKWLYTYFFFTVIEFVIRMLYAFGRPEIGINNVSIFYFSINLTGHVFIVFFVKSTFYIDRRSPFIFIFISIIIAKVAYVLTYSISDILHSVLFYVISSGLSSYIIFISSFWLSYAAFSSYQNIKYQDIAPWVKIRYLMVGVSALFLIAQVIPISFTPYRGSFTDPVMATWVMTLTLLNIIFAVLSFHAWVMPKVFKEFLNRNYNVKELPISTENEDALMEKLKSQLAKNSSE